MALSWKQPFLELMLHGKVETRTWATKYRGWVLMCASKTDYKTQTQYNIAGPVQFVRIWDTLKEQDEAIYKTHGTAYAIGKLIDCRPMTSEDEDKCFVWYDPNDALFCHVYESVQRIQPIKWKGTQGWKEVSEEIKNKIIILN